MPKRRLQSRKRRRPKRRRRKRRKKLPRQRHQTTRKLPTSRPIPATRSRPTARSSRSLDTKDAVRRWPSRCVQAFRPRPRIPGRENVVDANECEGLPATGGLSSGRRRMRRLITLGLFAACGARPAVETPKPARIAIAIAERGEHGARLVAIDEHGDRRLDLVQPAPTLARDTNPAISPDGRWLVFASS